MTLIYKLFCDNFKTNCSLRILKIKSIILIERLDIYFQDSKNFLRKQKKRRRASLTGGPGSGRTICLIINL